VLVQVSASQGHFTASNCIDPPTAGVRKSASSSHRNSGGGIDPGLGQGSRPTSCSLVESRLAAHNAVGVSPVASASGEIDLAVRECSPNLQILGDNRSNFIVDYFH
jgi:hypothetical protein